MKTNIRTLRFAALALAVLAGFGTSAFGQNNVWQGAIEADQWSTGSLWSLGHVPTGTEAAIIDNSGGGFNRWAEVHGTQPTFGALRLGSETGQIRGLVHIFSDGTLNTTDYATVGLMDWSTLWVEGKLNVGANLYMEQYGRLDVDGTVAASGWFLGNGYAINVNAGGALTNTVGMLGFTNGSSSTTTVAGTWVNTSDLTVGNSGNATLNINSGGSVNGGGFTYIGRESGSTGAVTVNSNATLTTTGFMIVGGTNGSTASGTLNVSGGTVQVGDTLVVRNGDAVNLASGGLGAVTITRDAGSTFSFTGGTLAVGTFNGNLTNQGGTLAPGASPGLTTVNGDYTQQIGGTLTMELGGTNRATGYDVLAVTGALTLGGTLDVSLYGGFNPANGDSFDILDWDSIIGTFDTINLPSLSGELTWNSSNLYTTGTLQVVPEPSTCAMLIIAAAGFAGHIVRRRRK